MCRVDDEVQEYLVQLTHIANHLRQLTEFGAHLGDVLVLIGCNQQRGFERVQKVHGVLLVLVRMRELLHRFDNVGHPLDAVESPGERFRNLGAQVLQIVFPFQLGNFLLVGAALRAVGQHRGCAMHALEQFVEVFEGAAQKIYAVAHILNRRVDLMGDTRREPTDRFQFLRQLEFNHHALAFLHFGQQFVLKFLLLVRFASLRGDVGAHGHRMGKAPFPVV